MPMQVRKGGVWQQITAAQVYANGAWQSLVAVKVYANGAWRTVANFTPPGPTGGGGGALSLSLSTTRLLAIGTGAPSLTTNTITVTPSGGQAPYSYSWTFVTQDAFATYSITAPTLATTAVSESGLASQQSSGCTIHCVVTDSLGATATSATVTASFNN